MKLKPGRPMSLMVTSVAAHMSALEAKRHGRASARREVPGADTRVLTAQAARMVATCLKWSRCRGKLCGFGAAMMPCDAAVFARRTLVQCLVS
jgi:hypothetical protein